MDFQTKMKKVIEDYSPNSWSPKNGDILCQRKKLSSSDPDYLRLLLAMQGDFNKKTIGIWKIENPILYGQFQLKCAEQQMYNNITIKELFHCSSNANENSILINNLDWRLCKRTKFGKGVSFSTTPSYANLQSSLKNGVHRIMIVADVIVGRTHKGNRRTVIPNNCFDTTVDSKLNVVVKYCDDEFYPKYVIRYETFPVVSINGQRSIKQ